jgi:UDP-N-acetylmuramoyl-tripeptide--D-alanyl-D-alanine ligase
MIEKKWSRPVADKEGQTIRAMTPKWGEITAGEIVTPIQGELVSGSLDTVLAGLSTDTRAIMPGQIFLALRGERFDGHDFLNKAVEKGTSCLILEQGHPLDISAMGDASVIAVPDTLTALGDLAGWWRRSHLVRVAAVTGSMGKTTVKEMAANILGLSRKTLKNKGNLNNLIGLPLTILSMDEGHDRAVLEMGMNRPGEIGRLTEIADPDMGLITNVAKVHLEGVGDIKGVARAKAELLYKISSEAQIIINGDDPLLWDVASPFRKRLITYGTRPDNDIRATDVRDHGTEGISFTLQYVDLSIPLRINVPGMHNLYNALAASAIAMDMSESSDNIINGLKQYQGIKGRFTLIALRDGITLVDDTYNANPTSLKAALDAAKALAANKRRIIVGLGEMMELGNETMPAHQEAGRMVAAVGASYLFVMGDHAREIIFGALDAGFPWENTRAVQSHEEMSQQIKDVVQHSDLILLKGSRKMRLELISESLKGLLSEEG